MINKNVSEAYYTPAVSTAQRKDLPHKECVMGVTLNCIRCYGSNSGASRSVEFPFIAIPPMYILTWSAFHI